MFIRDDGKNNDHLETVTPNLGLSISRQCVQSRLGEEEQGLTHTDCVGKRATLQ